MSNPDRTQDLLDVVLADGACVGTTGPDQWFPPEGLTTEQYSTQAKWVCRACPIKRECLDYAVRTRQEFGVWGGVAEHDLRALLAMRPGHVHRNDHDYDEGEDATHPGYWKCKNTTTTPPVWAIQDELPLDAA